MDPRHGNAYKHRGRPVPQPQEEEIYEDVDPIEMLDYEDPEQPLEFSQQVVQRSEIPTTRYSRPSQPKQPKQHVAHERKRHTHTSTSVEKQPAKPHVPKKRDLSAQTSTTLTKQPSQLTQTSQERVQAVETSNKKQPERKMIKIVIAVVAIAAILVALILFITFILAGVQVNLLKETQGSSDRTDRNIMLHKIL